MCSPKEVPHVQHGTLCAGRKEIQHKKYKNKITIKGNANALGEKRYNIKNIKIKLLLKEILLFGQHVIYQTK